MTTNNRVAEASVAYINPQMDEAGQGYVCPLGYLCPSGYKQTEVGVIPEDWDVKPLRLVLKEQPKYGINVPAVPLSGNLPVYIRITDIRDDGYFRPSEKVGVDSPFSDIYKLANGDIVLARTGASVGKSYMYNKEDGELVYADFLIKVTPDQRKLKSKFLSHYLKTDRYWAWVIVNSMRSGQPGINGVEYGGLLVPLPNVEEQTAIASALSDVDALLNRLETLITKKQVIKTATMQQLLTGRIRLPPFGHHPDGTAKGYKSSELGEVPEDWEVVSLSNIATVRGGKRLPKGENLVKQPTNHPYIRVSDMFMGGVDLSDICYVPNEITTVISNYRIFEGEIFISVAGTLGIVGQAPKALDGANLTENADRICNIKADSKFVLYCLGSKRIQDEIASQSTIGAQPKLALGRVKSFSLSLPQNREEQTAIATLLSDMDEEIQTLQQCLSKTRQIKRGMMQELLTGRIRLFKAQTKRI